MKVLVVSPVHPCPPDIGDKIRIYNNIKQLVNSHTVDVISLDSNSSVGEVVGMEKKIVCERVETAGKTKSSWVSAVRSIIKRNTYRCEKFRDSRFLELVRKYVSQNEYDLIWVHFINMMKYLEDEEVKNETEKSKVVLDQHNDFGEYWATYQKHSSFSRRIWGWWNACRVRELRDDVLPLCDVVLSVSEEDAESTRQVVPENVPVWVAPNGVDLKYFSSANTSYTKPDRLRLVYVGSMDVSMNADAVSWFVHNIFPRVQSAVPEVVFDIVGRNPTAEVQSLENKRGVRVTGRVEDVRPYYERAEVAIVPSRLGGGTKLKVLEAMAMGVPVVATSVGARGLNLEDGKHLMLADGEERFANSVVTLLGNPEFAKELAQAARRQVEDRYSWSGMYGNIIKRIESSGIGGG